MRNVYLSFLFSATRNENPTYIRSIFALFFILLTGKSFSQDPASFTAKVISSSQIDLAATANANNDNIVVIYNLSGTFTTPTDGTAPTAAGTTLAGSNGTIVYDGPASGLSNHTGLTSNTQYFYKAFSYDNTDAYSPGITADAFTCASDFTTSGGGSYCSGGTGVTISLSGSETGVSYQLKNGASPVGSPVAGTGTALDFNNITAAGAYTIDATNFDASCIVTMPGNATVNINSSVVPSVTISASPGNNICAGTSITFTAAPVNGGANPGYQWKLNGGDVTGETNATYTPSSLANGDKVSVVLTSNAVCPSPATATSNVITMAVNDAVVPTVSISASAIPICAGSSVTFTASAVNGGTTPVYQWKVNGVNSGTNSATFTSTALANGDNVSVDLTSNAPCAAPVTVSSSPVEITVDPVVVPSVSIAADPGNTICAGASVTFTATPVNGGTPSYQWKVNGVNAGTNSATFTTATLANGDAVTVVMTSTATCASPATATSNTINMTVNPNLPVSVNISSSATMICEGTSVTFTATPTNGGAAPAYQWQVNGANAGTNSATFATTALANNDVVRVIMTSNATPCATGSPATSNAITMTVNPALVPSVSIAANPGNTICSGTSVTFTVTPVNGGTPSYQWKVNGANVGTNSSTFTTNTLANGNTVTVDMTSNATCASTTPVTSNTITMVVNPNLPASVSISASATTICTGTSVTFTATPTNGGTTPSYQWQVNGVNAGTNSATFATTTLANNDVVKVVMTSNATPCATGNPATSNSVTMTVNPILTPSVSITASPGNSICTGTLVTFTATPANGGTAPTFQWKKNGANIVGATGLTYASSGLVNGDIISVAMTSNAPCLSQPTGTSNNITMIVYSGSPTLANGNGPTTKPTSNISGSVCPGPGATGITFTKPSSMGNAASYTWNLPPGFNITAGAGTGNITVSVPGPGALNQNGQQITVTAVNPCGSVVSNALLINVGSFAAVDAGPDFSICSGAIATLTNTLSGNASNATWTINSGGGTIAGGPYPTAFTYTPGVSSGTTTLTVTTNTASGSCSASTGSDQVVITINAQPAIVTQPAASQTSCSESNVTFSVTATGTGLTYKWRKGTTDLTNGGNISGANTATLTLTGVTTSDAGNYNVVVSGTGPCTSVTSNDAALAVNQAVAITTQPAASQTLCSGSNATFSVTATGTGLTYKWRKGTTDLTNGGNISGANTATLTLTGVTTGDAGNYNVVVSGTGPCTDVTSNDAVLAVNQAVVITAQPSAAQTLCSGSNATFDITATGTGLSYKWRKGTIDLTNGGNISGANTATLTLTNVTTGDAGNYNVVVSGTSPCTSVTSNDAALAVNQAVAITTQPASPGTLCSGSNLTFNVIATGTGLTYKWRKGTTDLINGGNISGANTATLTLTNVTTGDAGNYNVVVSGTSPCTSVTSNDAALAVNQAVAITTQPASPGTLCSGNNVTFNVTATGTGLTYKWRKGTTDLTNGGNISGANTATLTLTGVTTGDAGNYNVVVSGTGPCTSVTSNDAALAVNQAVAITTQPSNTSVCESNPADFFVVATGTSLTYQWYKVSTPSDILVGNSANLHFASATLPDDGTYYVVVSGASPCGSVTSAQRTLNVDKGITISTQPVSQTLCQGANVTFTVVADANGDPLTYQWRKNGTNIATATSATFTINGITVGDAGDYDVVISGPGGYMCSNAFSGKATLVVNPTSVGGIASASQTICSGGAPASITLSGNTGTVVQWQKSSDAAFTTPTDIANTATTLSGASIGTLTTTTYFRAVVQSGVCSVANSASVTITVDPVSVGGTVSANQTICSGSTPANLTLSGNTGNVVKWQRSSDAAFTSPTDLANTTTTLIGASIGALTTTTYFRAVVQSGVCSVANSASVTITVDPVSVGGTVSSNQTICSGSSPASLTLTGHTGSVVKWQKSSDAAFSSPTDIANTTTTLTGASIGVLTATTYFRAVVQSGVCSAANSALVTITVDPVSVGGTASANQTICNGSSPASLTLTGHTGSVVKWQKSSDAAFSSPTDIANTTTTLTGASIGVLTATTYFRAVVQSGVCSAANSALVTITVDPVSAGGTISANQTICNGSTPANLTLSGNTGNVVKWQKSSDAAFTSPTDIANTTTTLTGASIGALTATTYFRAVVQSGVCSVANAASVTITVDPASVGGTVSANQTICSGSTPADLTLSGNTGNEKKWQRSSDAAFTSPTDIANTTTTLTGASIGALTATTYFRAVVQSGVCAIGYSSGVTITIDPATVAGTASANQIICQGNTPASLSLTGSTGAIQWQKAADPNFTTGVSDIAGATSATLPGATIGALSSSTYFRARVNSGACSMAYSNSVLVAVNPPFTPIINLSPSGTICLGQTITASTAGYSARDTILGGNFSQANPPGWSGGNANNSNGNPNSNWGESTGGKSYTGTTYQSGSPSGPKFQIVNGTTSNASQTDALTTPSFSTIGRTSLSLQWYQGYNFNGSAKGEVQISIDGGATFTTLRTYNNSSPVVATNPFNSMQSINLDAYIGQPNVKIRFFYTGTAASNWALDDVGLVGPYEPLTYSWPPSFSVSATGDSATFTPGTAGSFTYNITTTTTCGTTSSPFTVIVNPLPTITGTLTVCAGSTTQLTGSGTAAATNPWVSSNTSVATVTNTGLVTGVAGGTSVITYTNNNGCSITATVTVNARPTVSLSGTTSICNGSPATLTLVLTGPGAISGTLSDGTPFSGTAGTITVSVSPTATTTYTIATTTNGTCASIAADISGSAIVTVNNPALITAQPVSTAFCEGGNTSFSVTTTGTAVNYQWQVNTGSAWANLTNGGVYLNATTNTLNITGATGSMIGYKYRVNITTGAPCNSSLTSDEVLLLVNNYWTGATSTDWNTAGNWSGNVVPGTACPDVYIPAASNQPVVGDVVPAITNLHVMSGATVTINNTGVLTIAGTMSEVNPGSIIARNGTLNMNGTNAQTIPASTFQNNALNNLVISNTNASGVSLGGTLDIYQSVTYGMGGTLFSTNGHLTLKSTQTETAWLGNMTGHTITGDVTVERYIATGTVHPKSWQLLAIPTNSGQSINSSWMEGATATNISSPAPGSAGNPVAGYGTMITSNLPNALAAGFDAYTSPGPSIKTYVSASNTYIGPSSTSIAIYAKQGYFVFVRGDRSVYTSSGAATPTILRTKGKLFTPANPPPVTSVTSGLFESVGNPYASAIDLRAVTLTGGVTEFISVWDPNLGAGSAYGLGAFQTLSLSGGNYYATPGGGSYGSGPVNYLQSGQAFFVQATGANGTVSFDESVKSSGSMLLTTPARAPGLQMSLATNLYGLQADGTSFLTDGVLNSFGSYSNSVDGMDGRKATNANEAIAINVGGKLLAIERRQPITEPDTIFLTLTGVKYQEYLFELRATNLDSDGLQGFFEDNFLETRTPLNMNGTTVVKFSITTTAGTYAKDRFRIVFAPSLALPVTFTSVKAYRHGPDVNVEWNVENELNINNYMVEKSTDGVHFNTLAVRAASNNGGLSASYLVADDRPVIGNNYYRIRSNDHDGKTTLTQVVKVFVGTLKQDITIYPNPVTDGAIHLQFMNEPEGKYGIRLVNKEGQVIMNRQINRMNGSNTELIKWDFKLAHGMYQLEITKPDGTTKTINIMY